MEPRERLEKLRRLKQLRQKAGITAPVAPAQPLQQPVQQTPVNRELMQASQPERARMTQEMTAQAFGDRPPADEYLIAGLFGTEPLRPSQLAGQTDLRQQEPGLSPAFMPELVTGIGGMAAGTALRNVRTSKNWLDDLVLGYRNRAAQLQTEKLGSDITALGTYKPRLSRQQKQMRDVLDTVPGIHPNPRKSINAVKAEIDKSGAALQSKLAHSGTVVSKRELRIALNKRFNEYKATKRGRKLRKKTADIEEFIDDIVNDYGKGPQTADGLWAARKEVDNEFSYLSGARRYEMAVSGRGMIPTKSEIMWDQARGAMLDVLEEAVPGSRDEMRRMSILYDSLNTLAEQAPDVARTLYGRGKRQLGMGEKALQLKPRNWKQ